MECYYVFCAERSDIPAIGMSRHASRQTSETIVYDWFTPEQHFRFTNVLLDALNGIAVNEVPWSCNTGNVSLERAARSVVFFTIKSRVYASLHNRLPDIFIQTVKDFEHVEAARLVEDI